MTTRDTHKDAAYWKRLLAAQKRWIADAEKGCETAKSATQRESACRHVWWTRLEYLLAGYSSGWDRERLQTEYDALVPAFIHHASSEEYVGSSLKLLDYYIRLLWIVSLGFVLDRKQQVKLVAAAAKHDGTDEVLDRIIASSVPGHAVSSGLAHSKLSTPLRDALLADDREDAASGVALYLRDYYKNLRKAYFWGRHTKEDILYFGYWAMEAAAVVRARKLDTESFGDAAYFPVDLMK